MTPLNHLRSSSDDAIGRAIEADDPLALDRAVVDAGIDALLPALLSLAAPDALEGARAHLPRGPSPLPRFDVRAIVPLGRVGFWAATEWALEIIPARERAAPVPSFERWDTLVEIHRALPETPWLVLALFTRLTVDQAALGRRALLGYRRRFGERGIAIAESHLSGATIP